MNETASAAPAKKKKEKRQTQGGEVMRRLFSDKAAMVGLIMFLILVFIAVFAPLITHYGPSDMDYSAIRQAPCRGHIFGTDSLGRDIYTRICYGAKWSLLLGLLSVIFSTVIGIVIGLVSGFFGRAVDMVIMRIMDIIQAIPGILLAIIISTVLGTGFFNTVLAMSIGSIPMTVRMLRAQVMSIREEDYVEAAESINCSKWRIMLRHIFPNSYSPLLVSATMGIGNTIMSAAGLSYLGLGIQEPMPEWGAILSSATAYIRDCPYMMIFPGVFIAVTVLALNLFGDGLRDALDPRLKE